MYISPINNSININSKAKVSLISEKNLLPKGATNQIIEKAKTIGNPTDTFHIAIKEHALSKKRVETQVQMLYALANKTFYSDYRMNVLIGSHKERQNKALDAINKYMDYIKKDFEILE